MEDVSPPAEPAAPTLFDLDDFAEPALERPQPQVPDMTEADDLFAPRTTNAPKVEGVQF